MTTVYNIFKNAINEAVNFNLSSSESIEKTLWFNLTTKKPEIVFSAGSFEKLLDTDAYTPQGEEKVREMMIMLYDFLKENKIPITPGFEREYFSLVSENRRKREPYLRCIVAGDDAIDKIKLCVERLGFENLNSEYKKEDIDNAIHVLIYYFNTCRQREQKLMEEES